MISIDKEKDFTAKAKRTNMVHYIVRASVGEIKEARVKTTISFSKALKLAKLIAGDGIKVKITRKKFNIVNWIKGLL